MGWWDEDTCRFVSPYFEALVFNTIPLVSTIKQIVEFPPDASAAEKIDLLIRTGLENMTPNDFVEPDGNSDKFEDPIGQLWAFYLKRHILNLYMAPQVQTANSKGEVCRVFNGDTDVAIELARNGTEAVVKEHWARFDDQYKHWKGRSAVLNIQLTGRALVAIPDANIYTFFKNSNKLYHGLKLVENFKGAQIETPPSSSPQTRGPIVRDSSSKKHYSTWSRPVMPLAMRNFNYAQIGPPLVSLRSLRLPRGTIGSGKHQYCPIGMPPTKRLLLRFLR